MTIYARAQTDPGGLALDDGTRRRSWAELAERSTRIAHLLHAHGIGPGDHAALLMENRAEFIEITLGALLAGVWLTPINWHLHPEEIAYVLRDSGARLLFSDDAFAASARAANAPRTLLAGNELDGALAEASDEPIELDGPAGGTMIYTSGTTGRPKGVKRKRAKSVAAAFGEMQRRGPRLGLNGSGPQLVTGPLYHAAPLLFAVYDQANGAPLVVMPRWDALEALKLLQEREIAHTHMVPTMFVRLLNLPEEVRTAFRAPRLELVMHGAAPVSIAVKRRMIEWWGEILVEYWGGTEGGVNTMIDSREWLAHPGTVGRALPPFEVFALDDAGRRLPPGEVGLLHCRQHGARRIFEYHGDPQKTAAAQPEPGVFTLGDIGSVDSQGYVFLADRKANMIISGGVNIYPAEIEKVLLEHPAVADVGVFGIPNDEWGESVKAAVELAPGVRASPELEAEILDFGRAHLAGYKVPRSIDFEERLPRQPSGKLYIRRLRDRYWSGRERKI